MVDVPPTPLDFENQQFQINAPPKAQTDFDIISDKNNSFNVIFYNCSNYIKIKSIFEKDSMEKEYEQILFLEELKSNLFLSICDSIDEMYDQIIMELKNNNKKNIIEENNNINIIIPINNIKVKEIKFTLKEKIKTQQELIQKLFDEIKNIKNKTKEKFIELEKENKNLRDEITLLKKENKKLNEKMDLLMKKNNNNIELKDKDNNDLIEKQINKESIELNNDNILKESSILYSDIDKLNQIKKWITEKTSKNNINFKLIFKMSENGYDGKSFHKICDNEAPTLIIIKSKNNKIFGGFTPLDWGKEEKPKDDLNQSFVFSLDINKRYDILNKKKYAIRCRKNEGPVFGNAEIKLGEDMTKVELYATGNGNYFSENDLDIIGEKGKHKSLETLELEIFKLIE